MNHELTYRLLYTPEIPNDRYINYFYSDERIHFKFLEIEDRIVLKGFEPKLSYLMTYLFNFSFAPTILSEISTDRNYIKRILEEFFKSEDVIEIQNAIKWKLGDFKGFKALLNRKISEKPFGKLYTSTTPLKKSSAGLISKGSLRVFIDKLKINLTDFLFNDGYEIEIYRDRKSTKLNNKFIKKSIKKYDKITANRVSLW